MKIISIKPGNQNIFGRYWKGQANISLFLKLNKIGTVHKLFQSSFSTQNESSSASDAIISDKCSRCCS